MATPDSRLAREPLHADGHTRFRNLEPDLGKMVHREIVGPSRIRPHLTAFWPSYDIDHVYHLAAYSRRAASSTPVTAHEVNVEGTMNLLEFAQKQAESHGRPCVPVSLLGSPLTGSDIETKASAGRA